jgi:hypothetical protein
VNGIDVFEAFRRKSYGEVFFTYAIDAMASEFLPSLIDKESMLI